MRNARSKLSPKPKLVGRVCNPDAPSTFIVLGGTQAERNQIFAVMLAAGKKVAFVNALVDPMAQAAIELGGMVTKSTGDLAEVNAALDTTELLVRDSSGKLRLQAVSTSKPYKGTHSHEPLRTPELNQQALPGCNV